MQKRVEFSVENQKMVGDLHLPEGFEKPYSCLIISHGYKSHRNSEKYFQIGYRFPLEGIAVLRFDHRGALNGESDGEFEDTTLTKRVKDLKAAIDFLAKVKEIDSSRLGLLGSSLGGRTVLALPKDERIKAIVFLATPVNFPRLRIEARESFEKLGYYQFPDGRHPPSTLPLKRAPKIKKEFYQDLERYNFQEEAKKINCPTLIIHGYLDEQVPRHQAKVLYEALSGEIKELKMIKGADHAFTNLEKLNEVLGYTLDWFKKYLGKEL